MHERQPDLQQDKDPRMSPQSCFSRGPRRWPEQLLLQADDDVVGIKVNGVCKLTGAGRYRQNCSWQGTSSARIDHA
jgi:hypothetical protein